MLRGSLKANIKCIIFIITSILFFYFYGLSLFEITKKLKNIAIKTEKLVKSFY